MKMGTLIGAIHDESREAALSLRSRGRGCAFSHVPTKSPAPQPESAKQRFNVDSPSFTPSSVISNGRSVSPKSTSLSPKAAIAAPFKPKGITPAPTAPPFTPSSKQYNPNALDWVAPEVQEFIPQSYNSISAPLPMHEADDSFNSTASTPLHLKMEYRKWPHNKEGPLKIVGYNGTLSFNPTPLQPNMNRTPPVWANNQPLWMARPNATLSAEAECFRPDPFQFIQNPMHINLSPSPTTSAQSGPFAKNSKSTNTNPPHTFSGLLKPLPQTPFHQQSSPVYRSASPAPLISSTQIQHENFRLRPMPSLNVKSVDFAFANLPTSQNLPGTNLFYTSHVNLPTSQKFSSINPCDKAHGQLQGENNHDTSQANIFEQYATPTPSVPSTSHTPQPQVNPYAQDSASLGLSAYYQGSSNYPQPLQYHLYAALGPHREHLQPNQRTARDLFIPEDLRQTLQRKSEATLTTFPNSTLPPNIAHFQGLVPLVYNSQKSPSIFGYSSWVYKATSSQDGKAYCLRRLQGYHLSNEMTNEKAIRSVQKNWKQVRNASVVSVHLAFTNSGFGDSSLIFVTDYHPNSETLAQKHFTPTSSRFPSRHTQIPEHILWSYIVQIASALKAIHAENLAARVIEPSKVLLTGENRIRLNGCAILDVVQHDKIQPMHDLQRLDLHHLGRLILSLGTNNLPQTHNAAKAWEHFNRSYTPQLRDRVSWLLAHDSPEKTEGIDTFLASIASHIATSLDASLHLNDQLNTDLTRELENSRIVRLLTKLNFLNERPEYDYSEHGNNPSRYILPLFRDYVFHQVDAAGKPVLDLAHVLSCLNKVDVGVEEKINLTTRDESTAIIVSYREVRNAIESVWGDLLRRAA